VLTDKCSMRQQTIQSNPIFVSREPDLDSNTRAEN
jgi:hypothetical protein